MKVEAIVLAGAANDGKLSGVSDAAYEALIPVAGRPMVHYVLDALRACESVERIILVGPREVLSKLDGLDGVEVVAAGESIVENLRRGIESMQTQGFALVVTSDIPMLHPEAVEDFLRRCRARAADIYYPIVAKESNEAKYPGVVRTYVRLKEGTFTGGNLALVKPEVVRACEPMIAQAVAMRKNPLKLSRLLGFKFIVKLLLRRLTLAEIEERVYKILGFRGAGVISPYPEVGIDIDKPQDLELVERVFRNR